MKMKTNQNGSQIKNYLEKYPTYNTMWEPQETPCVPPAIYSLLWSHLHFLERQWLLRGPSLICAAWEGLLACAIMLTYAGWWVSHVVATYGPTSTDVVVETVRPFFAPLTVLKKELDDELRKKDTEIPLSVHWSILIWIWNAHLKVLEIVGSLRFQWAQAPIINYPGLWTRGTSD
jgi:hypothetical protein